MHQPRFPWNKRISLSQLPFGAQVVWGREPIWPDKSKKDIKQSMNHPPRHFIITPYLNWGHFGVRIPLPFWDDLGWGRYKLLPCFPQNDWTSDPHIPRCCPLQRTWHPGGLGGASSDKDTSIRPKSGFQWSVFPFKVGPIDMEKRATQPFPKYERLVHSII